MADIDLSLLTPRQQNAADSFVVMNEGVPDTMGLLNEMGALRFGEIAEPAAPSAGLIAFCKAYANRQFAHHIGVDAEARPLQPMLITTGAGMWLAAGGGTIAPGLMGFPAFTITGFTSTARLFAATNYFTRRRRQGYVTAATAGAVGNWRAANDQYTIGSGAGVGGFFMALRFGISDAAAVAGARMFMGMKTQSAAANVEPNTLTNCIGIGHGAADANMKLFYGGSAAQTPIDLGANFPANTRSVDMYELALYAPPNTQTIHYQVRRLNTTDVVTGTLSGTVGTQVPAANTAMNIFGYRTNNATALACGLDAVGAYIEMADE